MKLYRVMIDMHKKDWHYYRGESANQVTRHVRREFGDNPTCLVGEAEEIDPDTWLPRGDEPQPYPPEEQ